VAAFVSSARHFTCTLLCSQGCGRVGFPRLGGLTKSWTILTLPVCRGSLQPCSTLPWWQHQAVLLRTLNLLEGWDDPSTLPQEEASVPFLFIQAQLFFLPLFWKYSAPCVPSACPRGLPLTHANLIHMALDSFLLSWKLERGRQESGGAHTSPSSSSFLPSLQMSFCEGPSAHLPWTTCLSTDGASGVGGCDNLLYTLM
jgi:hypothetical protein